MRVVHNIHSHSLHFALPIVTPKKSPQLKK